MKKAVSVEVDGLSVSWLDREDDREINCGWVLDWLGACLWHP